ncbi:hypothetical protein [Actinacidiphila acididurans]|uniref:Uncharacterized protein n=1 Tax=Actinacidiphila acididurans TaxID=2784346 RepID=A0ABS2TM73_9ACTN|nr:hypothetical protein [Actinacidiphila acididurans]MBM9504441.1 hypothetical protein [Actinacidiphila acididurans]
MKRLRLHLGLAAGLTAVIALTPPSVTAGAAGRVGGARVGGTVVGGADVGGVVVGGGEVGGVGWGM